MQNTPQTSFGPLATGLVESGSSEVISLRDHPAASVLADVLAGVIDLDEALSLIAPGPILQQDTTLTADDRPRPNL